MESTNNSPAKTPKSLKSLASWLRSPRNALLALVALLAILLIVLAASQTNNKKQPAPAAKTPIQASADVTDSGIVPGTLNIPAGTQVTWTNKGQKSHQVAADPYPLDNSIDGFNSSQVLLPGDSLTFTFEKKGTYHLHDNLNPLDQALHETVVVN